MKVKLQIYFKAPDGKTYKRVITYANPAVEDEVLNNFVTALYNLTTNDLKSVMKVVNTFLDDDFASEEIKIEDIDAILTNSFINLADEDGITQVEINTILAGSYEPVADDGITRAEVDAILSSWDSIAIE